MKKRSVLPFIVLICLAIAIQFPFVSCGQRSSTKAALKGLQKFKNIEEMSVPAEREHVERIKTQLKTIEGIEEIALSYGKSNDYNFKERLLYLCWELTFESTPSVRERIIAFLRKTIEVENNIRLRRWAAAGLVQCAYPKMETMFSGFMQDNDPVIWSHGARGLWKIGSESAVTKLIGEIKLKRTNCFFIARVNKIILQNTNRWTETVLREIEQASAGCGDRREDAGN